METIGSKYRVVNETTNATTEKWFVRGHEGYYKDERTFIYGSDVDVCYIPSFGFYGIDRIVSCLSLGNSFYNGSRCTEEYEPFQLHTTEMNLAQEEYHKAFKKKKKLV